MSGVIKPDWTKFNLDPGIVREADADKERFLVWLAGPPRDGFRSWERISNVPGDEIGAANGLCWTPATLVRARHQVRSFFGKLLGRFQQSSGEQQSWLLPDGTVAEQVGERQSNLLLVWAEDAAAGLSETPIAERWPGKPIRRLGPNLFVVEGVARAKPTYSPDGNAPEQADQLLTAARNSGDSSALALALTDSAIVATRNGDPQRAASLLEEALTLARQTADRARETDILGNLGVALLYLGQFDRAFEMVEEQLRQARAAGDRYEERLALGNLGMVYATLREYGRSIEAYEQALELARAIGDVKSQKDLLWYLAIQNAELAQRDQAMALGQECVALYRNTGDPLADVLDEHLLEYSAGNAAPLYMSSSVVVGVSQPNPAAERSGPGLLRMALTAMQAVGKFVGSGLRTAPAAVQQKRLLTCAKCEHHTGMRCKVCGCFTRAKALLPHEKCPLGKW